MNNEENIKKEQDLLKKARFYSIIGVLILLGLHLLINKLFWFSPYTIPFFVDNILIYIFVINAVLAIINGMFEQKIIKNIIIGVLIVISGIIWNLYGTGIFNSNKLHSLAGTVEEKDFFAEVSPIDLEHLPIVDYDLAKNLADKKLGELSSIGSQMTVGELNLQRINEHLYYIAPLEYTGFFKWYDNNGISPGYIKVDAETENNVEIITEINGNPLQLKYLDGSYFSSYIKRKAYSYVNNEYLTDFTFEVDNDGKPYWVITRYNKTIGTSGNVVSGILLMDAQNGEYKLYNIDEAPKWISRIQPSKIVNDNLTYYGKYGSGFLNSLFAKKGVTLPTDGMKIVYNNDNCYYYTGVTSAGGDESLLGFYLTDVRTGTVTLYKVSGATEKASMASAEGKVQEKSYSATFPLLINIQNEPTYFITLKDNKGLIKGYSFVNVSNYNVVGYGETKENAYSDYIRLLNSSSSSLSGSTETVTEEGIVDRIGYSGSSSSYNIVLKDKPGIYKVADSFDDVTVTNSGDEVEFEYIKNMDSIIIKEFKNKTLQ